MSSLSKKNSLIRKFKELEAVLALENGSVSEKKMVDLLKMSTEKLQKLVEMKNEDFAKKQSVFFIVKKKNQYELFIDKKFNSNILEHYQTKRKELSPAVLEVLAIVAYNQPITKAEIDDIRGVSNTIYLKNLSEEKLIFIAGKKKSPGNPSLFKTTDKFLKQFGLNNLKDLPPLEELKSYPFLD